jgi:hypothetical protein
MQTNPLITALAQSVYLRIKNRQYDDITGTDGQTFIANIIDFGNGFIDELENEVNADGQPIDWKVCETLGATLGTATLNSASISFPSTYLNLVAEEQRYVQILQDGTPVSNWLVVAPNDITSQKQRYTEDMVCLTGLNTLTFSRQFNAQEDQGTIVGDVTIPFPRMSLTNAKIFNYIKPRELLVLGIAKNSSLPDIVQGSLSPSFVQKYDDLLSNMIARNNSSGAADQADMDDYGYIQGIGF